MIRINTGADLDDMFGGQTEFEVSVEMSDGSGDIDIIGAGHTVAEAVADARTTLRTWAARYGGSWRAAREEEAMIAERAAAGRNEINDERTDA